MTLSDREQRLPCSCAVPLVIFPTLARYTQQRGMHLELKSKKFEIGRFCQGQTPPPLTRSPYNLFPPTLFTKRKVGGGRGAQPLFSLAAMAGRIVEQRKGQVSRPRSTLVHRLHHSSPPPFPCHPSSIHVSHARSNAITTKASRGSTAPKESTGTIR